MVEGKGRFVSGALCIVAGALILLSLNSSWIQLGDKVKVGIGLGEVESCAPKAAEKDPASEGEKAAAKDGEADEKNGPIECLSLTWPEVLAKGQEAIDKILAVEEGKPAQCTHEGQEGFGIVVKIEGDNLVIRSTGGSATAKVKRSDCKVPERALTKETQQNLATLRKNLRDQTQAYEVMGYISLACLIGGILFLLGGGLLVASVYVRLWRGAMLPVKIARTVGGLLILLLSALVIEAIYGPMKTGMFPELKVAEGKSAFEVVLGYFGSGSWFAAVGSIVGRFAGNYGRVRFDKQWSLTETASAQASEAGSGSPEPKSDNPESTDEGSDIEVGTVQNAAEESGGAEEPPIGDDEPSEDAGEKREV